MGSIPQGLAGSLLAMFASGATMPVVADTIYKSVGRDGAVSYGSLPLADAAHQEVLELGPYPAPTGPVTPGIRPGGAPSCGGAEEVLAGVRALLDESEARRAAGAFAPGSDASLYPSSYPSSYPSAYPPAYPQSWPSGYGRRGRHDAQARLDRTLPPYPNAPFGPPGKSLLYNDVRVRPERPAARLVIPPSGTPPPVTTPGRGRRAR